MYNTDSTTVSTASTEHVEENHRNSERWIRCLRRLVYPLDVVLSRLEIDIYPFTCQLYFFLACALLFDKFRDDSLKTLLFYSVFAHFVTKTRDIILSSTRRTLFTNWSMIKGLCRIVTEWAKAIIVVFCLREQGIYLNPGVPYAFLTITYYLCTEKVFTEIILRIIQYFAFASFNNMEHLYVPLTLNLYTIALSLAVQLYLFLTTKCIVFTIVCSYFTLYLRMEDSYNYWKIIQVQETFENFRNATQKELDEYDDVCSICLSKMSKAKITPCNHFFHPLCLKEWLKNALFCPLCKFFFSK